VVLVLVGGVVVACVWFAVRLWLRHLEADLRPATLSVADLNGVSFDGSRLVLARDTEVELRTELGVVAGDPLSMLGLRKVWSDRGGFETAVGDIPVDFNRVDRALVDPSGRYLLVHGSWKCRSRRRGRCAATDFAVVDLEDRTLFPTKLWKGLGLQVIKGWWQSGQLLAVRGPGPWEEGGGGRRSSDNLAPEVVSLDVATGAVVSLFRPTEHYFGIAGREAGSSIFLAAELPQQRPTGTASISCTEYRDFEAVNSFTIAVRGYHPILRQAELDASGRYWVLAFEHPPPKARQELGYRYSLWLVSRRGRSYTELGSREDRPIVFLDSFFDHGDPIVAYHREASVPELVTRRLDVR
jgi:hypothetical protein